MFKCNETVRYLVFTRDQCRCLKCGSSNRLTVHHLTPVRDGGPNTVDNLVTLCESCHRAWNQLEAKHIVLSFDAWLSGGEEFQKALEAALTFRVSTTGRLTGESYGEIARRLNEIELTTPRGKAWKDHSVRDWMLPHCPDSSPKRRFEEVDWPNFLEHLEDVLTDGGA